MEASTKAGNSSFAPVLVGSRTLPTGSHCARFCQICRESRLKACRRDIDVGFIQSSLSKFMNTRNQPLVTRKCGELTPWRPETSEEVFRQLHPAVVGLERTCLPIGSSTFSRSL